MSDSNVWSLEGASYRSSVKDCGALFTTVSYKMLKTYQFKTHCKGDSHSSKTANIILPGLMIKQW